ncbi:LysE family transporter [Streptomyces sp. NPDC047453]|uniref:LysE family transporter n=1 Tax=Streptomyces sp. NPDC047453 TaxID=3154812 RepID=UPI0033C557B7
MSTTLIAGLLAGYGIAVPVGAVATYLVTLTARTSLRTGVCAALGVATADGLYALLAALGGSALAAALRPVLVPLRWASALLLAALAVRGAVGAVRRYRGHRLAARTAPPPPPSTARAYLALLGITLLNPTTLVYFAALVLGTRGTQAAPPSQQAVFVLAALAASASWQLLLASGGALLGRTLTSHRGRLVTTLASSTVITALAVRMLLPPT